MRTFFLSLCGIEITGLGLIYFAVGVDSSNPAWVAQAGPLAQPAALVVIMLGMIVMATASFSARVASAV